VFIAGFRSGIGTDYENYRGIYQSLSVETYPYLELGYKYITLFFRNIGLPYEFSVFVFSFITNVLMYKFIKKHSVDPMASLLLYVLLNYYFIAFNAVRQMLAISIFLNGIDYIWQRRYIRFLMMLLLASFFHYTILIAVIYPLFKTKRRYIFLIFWFISLIFIIVPIQTIIIKIIPGSFRYAGYFTSRFFERTSQLSVFKLFIPNIFVLLAFYYHKPFKIKNDRFWFNLFIFSICVANASHGINILLRLNYVFQISEIIFYPLFISKIKLTQRTSFAYFSVTYFSLFYVFTVIIQGTQGVVPYQSVLF